MHEVNSKNVVGGLCDNLLLVGLLAIDAYGGSISVWQLGLYSMVLILNPLLRL